MRIAIDHKRTQEILDLVDEAISCLAPTPDWQVTDLDKILTYGYDEEALIELTGLKDHFHRLRAAYPQVALRNVLLRTRSMSGRKIEDLERELEKELAAVEQRTRRLWTLVLPFNVVPPRNKRPLRRLFDLAGHKAVWNVWITFAREWVPKIPDHAWKRINMYTVWSKEEARLTDYSFLTIRTSARDLEYARNMAYRVGQIFVSLVNFAQCLPRERIVWGEHTALSRIQSCKGVFAFDENGDFVDYFPLGDLPRYVKRLSANELNGILRVRDHYRRTPQTSLKPLLTESLILYHQAVTDDTAAFAFLKFWVALELMVRSKPGMKEDEVAKRVSSIVKIPYKFYGSFFSLVLTKRNRLVHQGEIDKVTEADLTFGKRLCDRVLLFIFEQVRLRRTIRELDILLELWNRNTEDLSDYKKTASYLMGRRNAHSESP